MKLSELIEIAKTKPTTPIYLYPDNYTIFEDTDLQPTYIEDPEERLRSNYIKNGMILMIMLVFKLSFWMGNLLHALPKQVVNLMSNGILKTRKLLLNLKTISLALWVIRVLDF